MAQLLIPSILPLNNTFTGTNTFTRVGVNNTSPTGVLQVNTGDSGALVGYLIVKTSASVVNQGGILISNVDATTAGYNGFKITSTYNGITASSVATFGFVELNSTETFTSSASGFLNFYNNSGAGYMYARVPFQSASSIQSVYSTVATNANAGLTTITQGLSIAGNLVTSAYLSDGYTAGLTWSSTDDNASKPKAGVFSKTTGAGTYVYIGTSSDYATGIVNLVSFTPTGGVDCAAITATSLVVTSSVTSGTALQITASSLTSGRGLYVYSNSSSASSFVLLDLTNANASATGAIPLAIGNLAPTSTNYFRMMYLGGNAGANYLWKANGVTPSGNLSGTAGDICIGADSGKAYYCGGGTTWTAM